MLEAHDLLYITDVISADFQLLPYHILTKTSTYKQSPPQWYAILREALTPDAHTTRIHPHLYGGPIDPLRANAYAQSTTSLIPLIPQATPPKQPQADTPVTTIYTDGSYTKDNAGELSAGFAAHVTAGQYLNADKTTTAAPDPPLHPDTVHTTDHLPSTVFGKSLYCHDSYSAEIIAIIVALLLPSHAHSSHP